jgi:S-adenosylmethionine synthetase
MANHIIIDALPDSPVEIVEKKGIGHPDTVCDGIAEAVSAALCQYYYREFGRVLHHNVDKALLVAGRSRPQFGGGVIELPIELYIAGRGTEVVGGHQVPMEEIAREAIRDWISNHFRFLDPEHHLRIFSKIRPGSRELVELFSRFGPDDVPPANDTSYGTGFYPFSPLQQQVLDLSAWLESPEVKSRWPFLGEDTKIMGVSGGQESHFTVAIAMIDRFLAHGAEYITAIQSVREAMENQFSLPSGRIALNAADDYAKGSFYLTVSGTSAEGADDGQVGRGNRGNGLITPYRPMSLEAMAGKNPVNHVGKIYNRFAPDLARAIVEEGLAEAAQIWIVSQIGKPIDQPQLLHIRVKNPQVSFDRLQAFASDYLPKIRQYWRRYAFLSPPSAEKENFE